MNQLIALGLYGVIFWYLSGILAHELVFTYPKIKNDFGDMPPENGFTDLLVWDH